MDEEEAIIEKPCGCRVSAKLDRDRRAIYSFQVCKKDKATLDALLNAKANP